jgi:hypothetical protein
MNIHYLKEKLKRYELKKLFEDFVIHVYPEFVYENIQQRFTLNNKRDKLRVQLNDGMKLFYNVQRENIKRETLIKQGVKDSRGRSIKLLSYYVLVYKDGNFLAKVRVSNHRPSTVDYKDPLKTINGRVHPQYYLFVNISETGSIDEQDTLSGVNVIKSKKTSDTNIVYKDLGKTNIIAAMNYVLSFLASKRFTITESLGQELEFKFYYY